MPRGRPRKTESERKLSGNPGKRIYATAGTSRESAEPECPDWLPDAAKAKWKETAAILRRKGRLTEDCAGQMAILCSAWHEMIQSTKDIEKNGRVLKKGDYCYPNPSVTQQRSAWARIDKALEKLGLDPRSAAEMPQGDGDQDELDEFLARRGK
jgi:P27 family predicted phage terminase small subunit